METIAVTQDQAKALLAEAKKRAKKTKVEGGYKAYFKHVRGAVPSVTDTGSSCAGHQLVHVVRGLRKCAGIVHKSQGNVLFASGTKLARRHPRGVACFMHYDMLHERTRPPPARNEIVRLRYQNRARNNRITAGSARNRALMVEEIERYDLQIRETARLYTAETIGPQRQEQLDIVIMRKANLEAQVAAIDAALRAVHTLH